MPDENTNTAEGADAGTGVGEQQQQGAAADWLTGLPEGPSRDIVVAKGYKTPADLASAYYNLTRIHTGSGDVLERPGADATPEQVDAFLRKVNGVPEDVSGYDLKFGDGVTVDEEYFAAAKQAFKDIGLRVDQAQKLADWNNKYIQDQVTKQAAAAQAKNETEIAQLRQKHGANFDQVIVNGRNAAKALGLSAEFMDRLDAANGPAVNLELLAMIGERMGTEAPFRDGAASAGSAFSSPEAARVEIARLEADQAFQDSVLDPKHAMHLVNSRRLQDLRKVAYGKQQAA